VDTLQETLPANAQLFVWDAQKTDNPYHALLGHADSFIVTGDSISMMVEVACAGKPLYIFQLPETRTGRIWKRIQGLLLPDTLQAGSLQRLGRALYRLGILGFPRSLTGFHDYLFEHGYAARLGSAPGTPVVQHAIPDDLAAVRQRILGLLESPRAGGD
jgi:hypothetical protein